MFDDGAPIVERARARAWSRRRRAATSSGASDCPTTPTAAAAHLAGANTYPFDVMKIAYVGPAESSGRATRRTWPRSASARRSPARRLGSRARLGQRAPVPRVLGRLREEPGRRPSRSDADTKTCEGRAFNVIVGNAQFTAAGCGCRRDRSRATACSTRSCSADRGPTRTGCCPRSSGTATTSPTRTSTELRAKIRVRRGCRPPAADRGRRRGTRHDPGHLPGGAPTDPAEAMNARHARPAALACRAGSGARRASAPWSWRRRRTSSYLTGYDPMPLERPTLLVLRPDRDPVDARARARAPAGRRVARRRSDRARRLARRRRPVRRGGAAAAGRGTVAVGDRLVGRPPARPAGRVAGARRSRRPRP